MVLAKGNARVKINVKRSVFIASAKECKSVSEAKEFIKSVSKEFGDATHNCWAYRVYKDGKMFWEETKNLDTTTMDPTCRKSFDSGQTFRNF